MILLKAFSVVIIILTSYPNGNFWDHISEQLNRSGDPIKDNVLLIVLFQLRLCAFLQVYFLLVSISIQQIAISLAIVTDINTQPIMRLS